MLAPVIDIVADQDTSVGVSGPHGLTVRGTTFVRTLKDAASPRGHRFPPQRPVTIAIRPSRCGRDTRDQTTDLGTLSTKFLVFRIRGVLCSLAAHTVKGSVLAVIRLDGEADLAREQDDEKDAASP
ncbi:hypothetical protein ACRAVF_09870 [Bradyrhizobium oligotrophicum S58]